MTSISSKTIIGHWSRITTTALLALFICAVEVSAAEIEIDATALSAPAFNIDVGASGGGLTNEITVLDLAPGVHSFAAPASGGKRFLFTVTVDGLIDLTGSGAVTYVTGHGTRRLTVLGLPMSVNATSLSAPLFSLDVGATAVEPSDSVADLRLLPGDYAFQAPHGSNTSSFRFTFSDAGVLDYGTELDPYVSGRATNTLTVSGFALNIDATALSAFGFNLNFSVAGSGSTNEVSELRLMPGDYVFQSPASSGTARFPFEVLGDGLLDFDMSLDGFVSGRSTNTLAVHGFPITVDATALSDMIFQINTGAAGSGVTSEITLLTLLPGLYTFSSDVQFQFFVIGDGTVDFDMSLDDVLLARGTSVLVILGDPGEPPTIADLVNSLVLAVDAVESHVTPGMQGILSGIDPQDPSVPRLRAFIRLVEAALSGDIIDPVDGQLLIARAEMIIQRISQ